MSVSLVPLWEIPQYYPPHRGVVTENGKIRVGEEGRGRRVVYVPVPEGAEWDGKAVMSVPTRRVGVVAALLIRDQSGYRGSWTLRAFPTDLCPDDGQRPPEGGCSKCGGRYGHLLVPSDPIAPESLGVVVASGYCAQGDAGRMGGGPEYLLLVPPCKFSISRSGRLYGAPGRIAVEVRDDGTVVAYDARQAIESRRAAEAW